MFDDARESTLFLGELPNICTEEDIVKLFRNYHPYILNVTVKRVPQSLTTGICHGFIRLKNREIAFQAMQDLQGILFLGCILK